MARKLAPRRQTLPLERKSQRTSLLPLMKRPSNSIDEPKASLIRIILRIWRDLNPPVPRQRWGEFDLLPRTFPLPQYTLPMTLREVLHAHIPHLTRESTVRDAVDKMDIYQFPALVIVDEDHGPVAVITEGDLCRAASLRDSLTGMASDPAHIYASQEPVTMHADAEIGEAFHKMLNSGLTVLPVVEDGRLSGIVLRVDLMQALLMDTASAQA